MDSSQSQSQPPQPQSKLLLQAKHLHKKHRRRQILQNVDFSIHAGEIITLIGPNGCGKTTLLKCLIGLDRADSGKIRRRRGLKIGYVPQKLAFEPTIPLTVEYFLRLTSAGQYIDEDLLVECGVLSLLGRQMRRLSGGELQRVLLVQALSGTPDLLVLDEPVQGVDFSGQAELYRMIRRISRERGCAVLMVSHDLHLVMAGTDKVLCLNGHICCHGSPQMVSKDPAFVNLFGAETARQLALYVHHHDHSHALDGHVVGEEHA